MAALSGYGPLDRLVHRLAFLTPGVQLAAAEMEDTLMGRRISEIEVGAPVFITSLPRAGTTTLLSALAATPELASHTYRDMPFVMAPMLWSRLSGRFQRKATLAERAHGDGIAVGYDSPEAFEEVLWRALVPGQVTPDGIRIARADEAGAEARDFFQRHFCKIVALRRGGQGGRYVSKNNGNMARLDLLRALFPDATILVPVRHPLAHAASLRRQHGNFLKQHAEDPFTRRYMADIGHDEFGALHRPILFPGFEEHARGLTPDDLDYWLAYWLAAFEHVAERRQSLRVLGYEDLCSSGRAGDMLCDILGLAPEAAPAISAAFRRPPPLPSAAQDHRSRLRDRAEALYAALLQGEATSADGQVQSSTVK